MQSRIVSLQCWDLTVCVNKLVEQAVDQSSGKDLLHIVSSDIHNWTMRQQGANAPPCPLGPADYIGSISTREGKLADPKLKNGLFKHISGPD